MSQHRSAHPVDRLADFVGRHAGATMDACGCGLPLNTLPAKPDCLSIGVNDIVAGK